MAETKKTIQLEVITPDASVFKGEVDFVLVRALDGDLGVMPNHAPLLASLQIWPLMYEAGGDRHGIFVVGGFLEVKDNAITVITPAAELSSAIDVDRAERARKRAEDRLNHQTKDIDVERAQLALHRAMGRIATVNQFKQSH
jgi:F-type H+-transporting ATPase subunit epsilon